jgi:TolB-like protein/class 3 adenylate cyclase/tetratricopeptide (TPR) repeat protein
MKQRLAAILAADAAGYSRLMAANESATIAALDAARAVFKSKIEANQGRVIDMAGDSVLAVFDTATGALSAALAVQEELKSQALALPEERRMCFRIGVHLGDVMEKADGTVYGDGVNIASRLQGLAEPGGITVSEAIHGVAKSRNLAFDDLGKQKVKNIAEPVQAFRARRGSTASRAPYRRIAAAIAAGMSVALVAAVLAWHRPWTSWMEKPAAPQAGLGLPAAPSIAVLPFENMGGDPEQSYFAEGMTEDLITDLSKVAGLFVIARHSTFAYKGKNRDVRDVARALGVRYVLEGSVRRSGADVRINAQLIDATTGGHVWADRYDGEMKSIFRLQDEVTRRVVAALAVELTKDDRDRVARRGTQNAHAYDAFLKGWQHYQRQTPDGFRAAIAHFKKAVELDSRYARAYAALAAIHWETNRRLWDVALGFRHHHDAQFEAEQFLAKAMVDPTALAHEVASAMLLHARNHEPAIAEARKAIAADPNDADAYMALAAVLNFTGEPEQALKQVQRAMRLNPHFPPHYLYQQGLAQFVMKRHESAAATLEQALELNPDDYWSQRLLLAAYGLLGQTGKAATLLEGIKKGRYGRGWTVYLDPPTIKAITYWHPFAREADGERFADGLRKAGVPD